MGAVALMATERPAPSDTRPLLASIAEAAEALGLGKRQLGVLEARGQLKIVRIGRLTKVPWSEIERLAREGAPLPEER